MLVWALMFVSIYYKAPVRSPAAVWNVETINASRDLPYLRYLISILSGFLRKR